MQRRTKDPKTWPQSPESEDWGRRRHSQEKKSPKTKNWSEDDDRDDVEFWEQQKQQEYLKNNPSHAGMFTGDDEEAELDVGLKNDEGTA
ncbi:hypothetical protein THAOC_27954, partial [Thalassiosira oceanica]